ncbi:MAG: regulatory iron-sulfur-containing complex subunit RicT [Oscillospiraceae bacterium]
MTEVVGVRFKNGGKLYYFDPAGHVLAPGEEVIIDTARGIEYGVCAEGNHMVDDSCVVQPLRPIIRRATREDIAIVNENREKEAKALEICQEKIEKHGLDMKLVGCEYNFERNKVIFFFTSDGRVDFRDLVKDLASVFHIRIELRQIGVRDEAKLLGGLGICGRPFCCASFLDDFQPVSIKMAKTQNLSLNPSKISGTCGRLMCCLKYEQDAYEDLVRRLPKVNSPIDTPDGPGTVAEVNLLRQLVKVRFENQADKKIYRYDAENGGRLEEYKKADDAMRLGSLFSFDSLDFLSDPEPARELAEEQDDHGDGKDEEQRLPSKRRKRRKKSPAGAQAAQNPNSREAEEKSATKAKAVQPKKKLPEQPAPKQSAQAKKAAKPNSGKTGGAGRARHNKYRGRAANRPPKPPA